MYIIFDTNKIDSKVENYDDISLSITLQSSKLNMQQLYDLVNTCDKSEIIVYNDDDTMHSLFKNYMTIESFAYISKTDSYTLCLSKQKLDKEDEMLNTINEINKSMQEVEANVEYLNMVSG